jgi:hypothetical protein
MGESMDVLGAAWTRFLFVALRQDVIDQRRKLAFREVGRFPAARLGQRHGHVVIAVVDFIDGF